MTCPKQDVNVELGTDVTVTIEPNQAMGFDQDLTMGTIFIPSPSSCADITGSTSVALGSAVGSAIYDGTYLYGRALLYGG